MAAAPPLLHVYQAPAQSFPDLKTTRRGFLVSKVRVIKKRSDEKHDSLERNSYFVQQHDDVGMWIFRGHVVDHDDARCFVLRVCCVILYFLLVEHKSIDD